MISGITGFLKSIERSFFKKLESIVRKTTQFQIITVKMKGCLTTRRFQPVNKSKNKKQIAGKKKKNKVKVLKKIKQPVIQTSLNLNKDSVAKNSNILEIYDSDFIEEDHSQIMNEQQIMDEFDRSSENFSPMKSLNSSIEKSENNDNHIRLFYPNDE